MRTAQLEANIWKYYVMRVMAKRLVWPILTIFLVRNDLSATEIGIIFSVGTIIGLILEVPSGAIADRIGHKTAMAIAFFGQAVSMLLFWIGDSFWMYMAGNALYYGAGCLMTGTSTAFLYETLKELGREHDFKKISGRALFYSQVITGVLFVVVPLIAKYSLHLPFLLNAFVFFGTCLLILTFVEPKREMSVEEAEMGKDWSGFKTFFSNPTLLAVGVTFGFMGGINGILEDFRQVYLDFIHVDLAYFGLVYLALRILVGTAGLAVDRLEKYVGSQVLFILLFLISLAAYLGLALIDTWYGLLFIVLDGLHGGLARPLKEEYLNKTIKGSQRATLLSVSNLIDSLIRAGSVFLGGVIIDATGIQGGFAFAAILLIVIGTPLMWWFFRQAKTAKLFQVSV